MNKQKALVRTSPIVLVENDELFTTSLLIAQKFGMRHDNVLQKIEGLNSGEEFNRLNFQAVTYLDAKGEGRKMYRVSEEGFMRIGFRFNAKRLGPMQDEFCNEFFRMRRYLQRTQRQRIDPRWLTARRELVDTRRVTTDTIKAFVEYATAQGSRNARMYYTNITKCEHKALFIVEQETGVPLRDRLNLVQLNALQVAEQIAERALVEGMAQGMPYRQIYVFAKERIEQYASLIGKMRVDDHRDASALHA